MWTRILLPLALLLAALLGLVLPFVRLYLRTGVVAVTALRGRSLSEVLVTSSLGLTLLGLGLWTMGVAALGPDALRAWVLPWVVAGLGWACILVGISVVVLAQAQMGDDWRIGVDENPTGLVTHGLYAWIRNPIYTGLMSASLGVVLITPHPVPLGIWLAQVACLHVVVAREERHMVGLHGQPYLDWAARTGRFLPGGGLRRP